MPARIIVVAQQKGGVGKTTISMHLAAALALDGAKVLVVDCDHQGSACGWAGAAPNETPFPATVVSLAHVERSLHRELKKMLDDYDYMVVDCPAGLEGQHATTSALLVADLVLVPVVLSGLDLRASVAIKKLIEYAQESNETLQAYMVSSMVPAQDTNVSKTMRKSLDNLGLPALASELENRTGFREAGVLGVTVFDLGSAARDMQDQVRALKTEIVSLLEQK